MLSQVYRRWEEAAIPASRYHGLLGQLNSALQVVAPQSVIHFTLQEVKWEVWELKA